MAKTGNQRIGTSGSQGILIGYEMAMRKIDATVADRLQQIRKLFNETGRAMMADFRSVQPQMTQIKTKVKGQDEKTANANVQKAVEYAKAHSGSVKIGRGNPWNNRTLRAARGVHVSIDADTEEISLQMSHGIYYGAYLEYGHNRKYAVLEPMIREYAPKIIEGMKKIMGGRAF